MTGTRTWLSGAGMLCLVMAMMQAAATAEPEDSSGPLGEPTPWGRAVIEEDTLRLHIEQWPEDDQFSIPRLNNPVRRVRLVGEESRELAIQPGVDRWALDLGEPPATGEAEVRIELRGEAHLADGPRLVEQAAAGGTVTLQAHDAQPHGEMLRYEPQPEKNTLGYWVNADDYAQWEVRIRRPGRYRVIVEQGCGEGHGGSEAAVMIAGEELRFTVEDTGHFQNFRKREVGEVTIGSPGRYELLVKPRSKANLAVMDLRSVAIEPVE